MTSPAYKRAAAEAEKLLVSYSEEKPPRFASPGEDIRDPERKIRQALADAQVLLNQVCRAALEDRIKSLSKIQQKQRFINLLHLLTGSGFVLLLTTQFGTPIKWMGAAVSFVAGAIALWLPRDVPAIETEISEDTNRISSLSGQIGRIETKLLLGKAIDDDLANEISTVIGNCRELAEKWSIGKIQAAAGVYTRQREIDTNVTATTYTGNGN
jgi:hypothetical protein